MPAGLRRAALFVTTVLLAALVLPAGALASGGGKCKASACQVYTESPGAAGGNEQQGPPSSGPATGAVKPTTHVPSKTNRFLAHAKDRKVLSQILGDPSFGRTRGLLKGDATDLAAPSALGAAFDLGSGPTVLLAILLATALALAAHGGIRSWRRRRPSA